MSTIDYSHQRNWNDVEVGNSLGELEFNLDWTAMVLQVSGSQDWTPIHHDFEFAKSSGIPTIFYNTGWIMSIFGRLLTDWAGPQGWVYQLGFQMRGMNMHESTVTVKANVENKRIEDDKAYVDIRLILDNSVMGTTTVGKAVVILPQ